LRRSKRLRDVTFIAVPARESADGSLAPILEIDAVAIVPEWERQLIHDRIVPMVLHSLCSGEAMQ
jgi:hypothetical protein